MYGVQSHKKFSPLNFHCLEKMFTNSKYFKLPRVISLIKYINLQFNYCYYYILKNCGMRVRQIKTEYVKS